MELFLLVTNNKILDVLNDEPDEKHIKIKIESFEDFIQATRKYNDIDEDIQKKVEDYLEPEEENNTLNSFNIKHWVSNRSFGELIDMYNIGEIIKPAMQREFVWDSIKCSRLIESIIMKLPIPPLFLLETDNNNYELIDGFQRLTAIFNFVRGNPWHDSHTSKKKSASKLSNIVSNELQGKSFDKLDPAHQKLIKRSTIPLIEFRQFDTDKQDSKYLIFERINTGSAKLNHMQIRKSLAHGNFINSLYDFSSRNQNFLKLFSRNNIKKDLHVEAYLRVMAMKEIASNNFKPEKYGIKNILNEYCERNRAHSIKEDNNTIFDKALDYCYNVFKSEKEMFKRVEKDSDKNYVFKGYLNISILDALLGSIINIGIENIVKPKIALRNYKILMNDILLKAIKKTDENPFTTSTGSALSINKRFEICKTILTKK